MPADVTPLRRRPVQQRSARRVERMLDACADLIAEVGYDGVTTTLIAERAGVAVGSLYQFFPDKRAVVQALTLRNLDRFMNEVGQRFAEQQLNDWWQVVDSVFDIYVSMHRDLPAFRKVHFGDVIDPHLMDEQRDSNTVIAERLSTLITERFGFPESQVATPMAVAIEAADSVLKLAFRRDPDGDAVLISEAKELIRDYLSKRIG
ncbi:TetR family transcriptional regulator [Allokutzneria sp. A3M-2-11 16]|uniref:TetR family transcriptional regulator n=1 Tax=Allokutzneria sp. A3M-2-11 16 TaxID=2962043 RepID=UPI0020B648C7|nr:TetR family transcriptional regulator [Allokutzneria sp. A3M-2-11 16]MCP3799539.1 TetR family transcriptional regulator [Allokutzneria sp. A3M-2-11 16]